MIIKEYMGSLDIVDEKKLAKVKVKQDKLKAYQEKIKKAQDARKTEDIKK